MYEEIRYGEKISANNSQGGHQLCYPHVFPLAMTLAKDFMMFAYVYYIHIHNLGHYFHNAKQ